tara:strand:+ start:117 stop:1349 length:1233 start_codon:yes stop_codon:yes gene_type:complete
MGWLSNYKWIQSLRHQNLPKPDYAKASATKAENKAASKIRKFSNVIKVYHALRLNTITGGYSRREVDLLVLMKDRIVLIEVKNFAGTVQMNSQGELLQNGINRNWRFSRLDDAKLRLIDIMRETGIELGKAKVHSILALLGSGNMDDSVTAGNRLTGSTVVDSMARLEKYLARPLDEDGSFSKKHLEAIKSFLDLCGTWDCLKCANDVEIEGDFLTNALVDSWREVYHEGRFFNRRGWFSTLFFGPAIQGEMTDWNGQDSIISLEPHQILSFKKPGEKDSSYRIDNLHSFKFGYKELPDWSKITLISVRDAEAERPQHNASQSINSKRDKSPYAIGDTVRDATVSFHHDNGILFRLNSKNKGMFFSNKMSNLEWENREMLYPIGTPFAVKIQSIRKKRNKWEFEVSPLEN